MIFLPKLPYCNLLLSSAITLNQFTDFFFLDSDKIHDIHELINSDKL